MLLWECLYAAMGVFICCYGSVYILLWECLYAAMGVFICCYGSVYMLLWECLYAAVFMLFYNFIFFTINPVYLLHTVYSIH